MSCPCVRVRGLPVRVTTPSVTLTSNLSASARDSHTAMSLLISSPISTIVAGAGERHALQGVLRAPPVLRLVQVVEEPGEFEVLPAGEQLVDRGVLAREPDHRPDRPGVLPDVQARHPGTAAVGLEKRRQYPDQGGLPGAVRAEKGQDVALWDAERHVIQRQRAAEPLRHALNFNRGTHS